MFIARAIEFFKYPRSKQIECFKEWLVYAVSLAEKYPCGRASALKLRQVYDNFAIKFPTLVEFISFEKFSNYVDEALISMRKMLECNKDISVYINGDKTALIPDIKIKVSDRKVPGSGFPLPGNHSASPYFLLS